MEDQCIVWEREEAGQTRWAQGHMWAHKHMLLAKQKLTEAIDALCLCTEMHVRCNQILYNVSKGLAALNAEVLALFWHSLGTWQGQRTRCSSDVAGVWRRGGDRERERVDERKRDRDRKKNICCFSHGYLHCSCHLPIPANGSFAHWFFKVSSVIMFSLLDSINISKTLLTFVLVLIT